MSNSIVHKGVTTVKIYRYAHARSAIAALVLGGWMLPRAIS